MSNHPALRCGRVLSYIFFNPGATERFGLHEYMQSYGEVGAGSSSSGRDAANSDSDYSGDDSDGGGDSGGGFGGVGYGGFNINAI